MLHRGAEHRLRRGVRFPARCVEAAARPRWALSIVPPFSGRQRRSPRPTIHHPRSPYASSKRCRCLRALDVQTAILPHRRAKACLRRAVHVQTGPVDAPARRRPRPSMFRRRTRLPASSSSGAMTCTRRRSASSSYGRFNSVFVPLRGKSPPAARCARSNPTRWSCCATPPSAAILRHQTCLIMSSSRLQRLDRVSGPSKGKSLCGVSFRPRTCRDSGRTSRLRTQSAACGAL